MILPQTRHALGRRLRPGAPFTAVAVSLTCFAGTVHAGPAYIRYQVTNDDFLGRTATDLTLNFDKPVLTGIVNGAQLAIDDLSLTFGPSRTTNPGTSVTFNVSGSVPMGKIDTGIVAFPEGTQGIKAVSGSWSYPVGADRSIPLKNIMISAGKKDDGVVEITNDESQTVYFSNVLASTNIPSSNFINPTDSQLLAFITNNLFATARSRIFRSVQGKPQR